ncbi:uncharacterized protein LOC130941625 [Arachis stenosperma]|uniref:uncharacterized protein LOC130941625 n=1 Tax=Arachis stenosperma TaxID=217475 RepID=UPI0025AC2003|nr:uncharacterized protein LOC130941625 [Arachis stenosperma]
MASSMTVRIDNPSSSVRSSNPYHRFLIPEMGTYFDTVRRNSVRLSATIADVSRSEIEGKHDTDTYRALMDMLTSAADNLTMTDKVTNLWQEIYYKPFDYTGRETIQLRSSDREVLEIDKSLAKSGSGVLKDAIELLPDTHEVATNVVSAEVLKEVILFLEKKRDFQQALKVDNKVVDGYKSWSKYFINRNADILPELYKAAKDLRISSLLALTNKRAAKKLLIPTKELKGPNDCLNRQMFHYFICVASDKTHRETILTELDNIRDDSTRGSDMVVACKELRQWLTKVGNSAKPLYEDFESLMESHPFQELCLSLYQNIPPEKDHICLRSCDGSELKMDKSLATAESRFLQDRIDSNPDLHEVEVPVDRDILSQVIDFCKKKWDFSGALVSHFKRWATFFLERNRNILSNLNVAADYLFIPSLLELTTNALANSVQTKLHPTAVWTTILLKDYLTSHHPMYLC